MSIQSKLASVGGDIWFSKHLLALWPWPAVVYGQNKPKVTWDDYRLFGEYLRPGDFLLTRSAPYFLSNSAIPGAYKHLIVYMGCMYGRRNSETHFIENLSSIKTEESPFKFERTVIHAISEGVVCQDFGEIFFHCDYIAAVRSDTPHILERAEEQLGKEYDFDFILSDSSKVFCTELGALCHNKILPRCKVITNWKGKIPLLSKRYVSDIVLADTFIANLPVVCVSASSKNSEFIKETFCDVNIFHGLIFGAKSA